jgi:Na+(H+)/acetate symporter ActP
MKVSLVMGKDSKKGFNKYNAIALLLLLAVAVFLIGFDPFSWMNKIQVKLLIGAVLLVVILISLRSLYKSGK